MPDDSTPTVVDPIVPDPAAAPIVDPLADAKAEWKAQTDSMLEKIGVLESKLAAAATPREARVAVESGFPEGHPFAGVRTEEEARAKFNELIFSDASKAFDTMFAIKAGPIIAETRAANAAQAKKAAFAHPLYGPLLTDPTILKTFEDGWERLPPESRVHEQSAIETAKWAAGTHMDIVTKRAGDAAVVEERKRAPQGHTHAPGAAPVKEKEVLPELSQEEKDAARKLGVDEKDYAMYKGR